MRHSYLIDHLEIALKLAEAEGEIFVAYLIRMAKEAAPRRDADSGQRPRHCSMM